MSYKKILSICLLVSILLIYFGQQLVISEKFRICVANDMVPCEYYYGFNYGHPLVLGLTPIIPILILLHFFRKEVFLSWCKYAAILIPLIIIIILNTPVYCGATLGLCLDKKGMTKFLADIFAVLSLIIIITKSFMLKRVSK